MDILGINPMDIFGGGGDEQAPKQEDKSDGGLLGGIPILGDLADMADDAGLFGLAGSFLGNSVLPVVGGAAGKEAGEAIGDAL
jgi:hypothetical protein